MILQRFSIFLTCCLYLVCVASSSDKLHEQDLIKNLLSTYSKHQKPAGEVGVKFALNLNQIVSVKAKDQIFML